MSASAETSGTWRQYPLTNAAPQPPARLWPVPVTRSSGLASAWKDGRPQICETPPPDAPVELFQADCTAPLTADRRRAADPGDQRL